ncbi:hypothetical protein INS49_005789 [Diaporthe citri]|uniref:uncharacterized protein n=1 Tax=Diaporthe citri TaxID=83186 RepID=UPI001C813E78|nr:uncharacterized protein INS49_005789 [Diaporthe citri]KAG6364191.1 hypothetical protein INS49_005789 [Diaporthe citri]
MSREFLDENQRRNIPLYDYYEEEVVADNANVPSVAAGAAPPPSTPGFLAPTSTAPDAGKFMCCVSTDDLVSWVDIPDILSQDLQTLSHRGMYAVSMRDRARIEEFAIIREFVDWLTSPRSSQLLIEGDYSPLAYMSGLSHFCVSLERVLARRAPRSIPLVFFCGLHTELLGDAHTGGRALVQSFIRQLLDYIKRYQLSSFNGGGIPLPSWAIPSIRAGDLSALCVLFESLVRFLPSGVALYCLVDGVAFFEGDGFLEDLTRVLEPILQLSRQRETDASLKLLLTSPTFTLEMHRWFPLQSRLSMGGMRGGGPIANSERLEQELASALQVEDGEQ